MKNDFNIGKTTFVQEFYPGKGSTNFTLVFKPARIIDSNKLLAYTNTKSYFNEDQKQLLNYVFGDKVEIKAKFDRNPNNIPLNSISTISLGVSKTGSYTKRDIFYTVRQRSEKPLGLPMAFNFIYYNDTGMNIVTSSSFTTTLKHYVKQGQLISTKELSELNDSLNSVDCNKNGLSIIKNSYFKSTVATLSKILITLFPNLSLPEIVELTDFLKSEILSSIPQNKIDKEIFELKGDLITYFYNHKNYALESGTLGNSCMRYDTNNKQLQFYANNPTSISLLSFIKNKKLYARAVLWTDVENNKYCDRIYCATSEYGIRLTAYCKARNYKCIHETTSKEYGLPYTNKCIAKLDNIEIESKYTPFFDSMQYIDICSSLLSVDKNHLMEFLVSHKKNYIIREIYRAGANGGSFQTNTVNIKKGNSNELKYLKDESGEDICNYLSHYVVLNKPKVVITHRNNVVTINKEDKYSKNWVEKTLIKRYNCLRPTLTSKSSIKEIKYYDKKNVVYSNYHGIFVPTNESVYVKSINSYVLKDVVNTYDFKLNINISKLRKIYSNKLVKISEEFIDSIKEQLKTLPFKESLIDIRKSRVYNIHGKNIKIEGVKIKNIIVPFRHLRFIKK